MLTYVRLVVLIAFSCGFPTPTTVGANVTAAGVVVSTLAGLKGTLGTADGTGTAARFNRPFGIAVLLNGNIVLTDFSNHAIRYISKADGVVSTLAGLKGTSGTADGTGTAARFHDPYAIAGLPNGDMVVVEGTHAIRYITAAGVVTTLAGLKGSYGVSDGTGTAARFYNPSGIAALSNGDMVVADLLNHAIRYVTAAGVVSTLAGLKGTSGTADGTGTAALFYNPQAIATLPNGDFVVADYGNHAIRFIAMPSGAVSTLAGLKGSSGVADGIGTVARFYYPNGIAALPNGDVVVADTYNHAIRYITMPNGVVITLAGLAGSSGVADGTGPAARFYTPIGIATFPNGSVVVADSDNHAIRYIANATTGTHTASTTRSASLTKSSSQSLYEWTRTKSTSGSSTFSLTRGPTTASESISASLTESSSDSGQSTASRSPTPTTTNDTPSLTPTRLSTASDSTSATLTASNFESLEATASGSFSATMTLVGSTSATSTHGKTISYSLSHFDSATVSPSHSLSGGTETPLELDSLLRSSNSTVEFDALLEVPTAFRFALDQLSLTETQELLEQRGRRRTISLEGDVFQPIVSLNGDRVEFLAPGQASLPSVPSPSSASPLFEMGDETGCWILSTKTVALLDYIRANATIRLLNNTSLQLDFSPIPTADPDGLFNDNRTQSSQSQSATAALVKSMRTRDEWLTIRVADRCVKGCPEPKPLVMKFLRIPSPSSPPRPVPAIQAARTTLYVVQLVTAGGALAISSSRSSVVLELFTCYPDFNNPLDWMDNPFQTSLSTEQYSQYLGASTMNHLLIYGLPILHAFIGGVYSRSQGASVWDGFVWARFPSLSLLPLQYFIETTAQSATIVATFAATTWHRAIAGISLCFLLGLVVVLLVYLTRTWGPQYIPGTNPMTLARRKSKKNSSPGESLRPQHAGVRLAEGRIDGHDQRFGSVSATLKLIVESICFCIDGDVSWRDSKNCRAGYCRSSRLLFMDYTPSAYWFMSVELGVALLTGVLGGIKVGTCYTVAIVTLVVLCLFFLSILILQPYNSTLGVYFNILVTALQVLGATFAVIALSRNGADRISYQHRSELMSIFALYLLVGKAVLDLLPKLRDLIVYLHRLRREGLGKLTPNKQEQPQSSTLGTHDDLTEKLLQTIQASSAADANWASSIDAVAATPVAGRQDVEGDELRLDQKAEINLSFPLPPELQSEKENWGYEWDETALGLQVPTLNAGCRTFMFEDDDDSEISLLKRLRPRDFHRVGKGTSAGEIEGDGTSIPRRGTGQHSLHPSLPP